jgi:hypothetical protein
LIFVTVPSENTESFANKPISVSETSSVCTSIRSKSFNFGEANSCLTCKCQRCQISKQSNICRSLSFCHTSDKKSCELRSNSSIKNSDVCSAKFYSGCKKLKNNYLSKYEDYFTSNSLLNTIDLIDSSQSCSKSFLKQRKSLKNSNNNSSLKIALNEESGETLLPTPTKGSKPPITEFKKSKQKNKKKQEFKNNLSISRQEEKRDNESLSENDDELKLLHEFQRIAIHRAEHRKVQLIGGDLKRSGSLKYEVGLKEIKMCLLGDSKVGKTAMVTRY